jgi:hypothetical protein
MSSKLVEDLKKKTVLELKSYAKKNNIDLFGVSTKAEILEVILSFVPRENNQKITTKNSNDKVALFSPRNIHWNGVGVLERGYNIVTKEASEMWLRHKAVRLAQPDEVAIHYGKA